MPPLPGKVSAESAPRERRSHAENPVTGSPGAVHPIGHPIIHSKKRGLEIRSLIEDPAPKLKLTRTGSGEGGIAIGVQPIARITIHRCDQARAALVRLNCPLLVFAIL